MTHLKAPACIALAAVMHAQDARSAQPENDPVEIDFEASAGVLADSNVNIADLDQSTGEGDVAAVLGASLAAEAKPAKALVLRGGYEFSQISYQDFGAFNLQTHRGSADAEYDFNVVKAGALYNFVHARLDGAGYLDYQQISPYVSRLFGKRLFLRGAYAYADKNFIADDRRDSAGHSGQADAFVFLDGLKRYVILGGKLGGEDAVDDQFDLDRTGVKARFIQRFQLLDRETKFRAGVDYEHKDYRFVTPAIDEKRDDKIFSADAEVEVPVVGPAALNLGYDYRDRDSNLPSADYVEHVGEMKLVIRY